MKPNPYPRILNLSLVLVLVLLAWMPAVPAAADSTHRHGPVSITPTPNADAGNLAVPPGNLPASASLDPDQEGSLSGYVMMFDGTTPLPGALVQVTPYGGGPVYTATSGAADGAFIITGLPAGFYVAVASKAGYEDEYYDHAVSAEAADLVQVTPSQETQNINFTLTNPQPADVSEHDMLLDFYLTHGGPDWNDQTGWQIGDNVCNWHGITCLSGHVAALNLSGNNVTGSLTTNLVALTRLQVLDLSNNPLGGSLNASIGNLDNLRILNLNNSQMTDSLPNVFSGLSRLKILNLAGNSFGGNIPKSLGSLTGLRNLFLNNDQLTGAIPDELASLGSLRLLHLENNQLDSSIPPGLGSLALLSEVYMVNNQLTGSIPQEIGGLSDLNVLRLDSNQLNGSLPASLGSLGGLTELNLSFNQLDGSLPDSLGSLANLIKLELGHNQLTGSIPPELGNLANLQRLDLYFNQLSGSIPSELGNLGSLQKMDFFHNQLSGSIPSELGSLHNLNWLDLGSNQLSGAIPVSLGSLNLLQWFYLDNNQLSGTIPTEFSGLSNLIEMMLGGNNLSGPIPSNLDSLSTTLHSLYLDRNQLTGPIPASLGSLSNLTELNLSSNTLSGSIPASLGSLINLTILRLDDNHLDGDIPLTLDHLSNLSLPGQAWDQGDGLNLEYNRLNPGPYPQPLLDFLTQKDPTWLLTQSIYTNITSGGGELKSRDNHSDFIFPPGAVTEQTIVTYAPQKYPRHPYPASSYAHKDFLLSAVTIPGQPVTTFLHPVTVILTYTDAEVQGLDERYLFLVYWSQELSTWVDAASTCPAPNPYIRHPETNTLSINICHLTEFSLITFDIRVFLPMVRR